MSLIKNVEKPWPGTFKMNKLNKQRPNLFAILWNARIKNNCCTCYKSSVRSNVLGYLVTFKFEIWRRGCLAGSTGPGWPKTRVEERCLGPTRNNGPKEVKNEQKGPTKHNMMAIEPSLLLCYPNPNITKCLVPTRLSIRAGGLGSHESPQG